MRSRKATVRGSLFISLLTMLALPGGPGPLGNADLKLFGPGGVRPQVVRQGLFGSCYFHAAVAAIAQANPEVIRRVIRENQDNSYTVQFPDKKTETAYPEDLKFARESGYERSDDLWVGVLLRAYAQRVLRAALVGTVDNSSLSPILKTYMKDFLATNDAVLVAYDRAIRTVVDQNGNINRVELVKRLRGEMAPFNLSSEVQDTLIGLIDSKGLLDSIAAVIRENGEIFGAYRAVGQGGLPGRVLEALMARRAVYLQTKPERRAVVSLLENAASQPVVAMTGAELAQSVPDGRLTNEDQKWYLGTHAFTVLRYDPVAQLVTVRNPWASHPDPDGVFTIPLAKFLSLFTSVVTTTTEVPAGNR